MEVSLRESTEIDGLGAAGINDAASTNAESRAKEKECALLTGKKTPGSRGDGTRLVLLSGRNLKTTSHSHTQGPGTALCVNRIR